MPIDPYWIAILDSIDEKIPKIFLGLPAEPTKNDLANLSSKKLLFHNEIANFHTQTYNIVSVRAPLRPQNFSPGPNGPAEQVFTCNLPQEVKKSLRG